MLNGLLQLLPWLLALVALDALWFYFGADSRGLERTLRDLEIRPNL